MSEYRSVCRAEDIPPGSSRQFEIDGRSIALANVAGAIHAVDGLCPHRGGPLGDGHVEGSILTCPWHGWQFDVATGESPRNPTARLSCHAVRVRDGAVEVAI